MKKNNPMKNKQTAQKMAKTLKDRYDSGKIVLKRTLESRLKYR